MIKIKAEAFLRRSLFQYVAKEKTPEKQQKESYIFNHIQVWTDA